MVSTAATNSVSGGKASTAASSPIPSTTPEGAPCAASRGMKNRRISSNSPRSVWFALIALFRGGYAVLVGPQFLGGPVQYGIDELMPIGRAELLGQLHRFGECHPVGQFGA